MPTLDDLRAAFDELERQAPVALAEPVRPTHRRRWAAGGLAAACTAAVAVAVPLALGAGTPAAGPSQARTSAGEHFALSSALPAPAPRMSPALTYGFAIPGTPAGYTVVRDQVTADYQHASVYASSDPAVGEVFVFYRDAFDTSALDRGDPVTVNGADGYYTDLTLPHHGPSVGQALVWRYAPGGWAAVRLHADTVAAPAVRAGASRTDHARVEVGAAAAAERNARAVEAAQADELTLADALVAADDPLRSPVRMATAPGWYVDDISTSGIDGLDGGVDLTAPDGTTWDLRWSPGALSPADEQGTSTVEVAGRRWVVQREGGVPSSLWLVSGGRGLTVTPNRARSLDAMEQFAAGLQFASDPGNPGTWFDAATSLP